MRLLVGLQQLAYAELRVPPFQFDMVEIPFKVKGGIGLPQLQYHVDALDRHQPLRRRIGQVEKTPIRRHSSLAKTTVDAAARQMIQIGQSHRHIDRMMLR